MYVYYLQDYINSLFVTKTYITRNLREIKLTYYWLQFHGSQPCGMIMFSIYVPANNTLAYDLYDLPSIVGHEPEI